MIRVPLRRRRPPQPETTGNAEELSVRLEGQLDAVLDPRTFPEPQPTTPLQIQVALLTVFDQALDSTHRVLALVDQVKSCPIEDRTISALCDAAASLQDTLAPLAEAAISTCPDSAE